MVYVVMRAARPLLRAARPIALASLGLSLIAAGQLPGTQQTGSEPTPVSPGDTSKPSFDTKSPVYDSVASLDKAASTVVAEVEGRPITLGDVGDAIRALPGPVANLPFDSLFPVVLDQLIRTESLVVRAQQQGIDEKPAVRRKVRQATERALAEEYLREKVSSQITEAMLLDRYNRTVAGQTGQDEVRARIILVSGEKAAVDLIARARAGADFATLARENSKDETAQAGGDLGFQPRDGMIPEVGAVAFSLGVGEVAAYPVRAAAGWFVVKVEERGRRPPQNYAAVRERLRADMLREGVIAAADSAAQGLHIRRYNINGKEVGVTGDESAPSQLGQPENDPPVSR